MNSAWDVKIKDFPKKGSLKTQIEFCLSYGILAPSTHNSQPWRFEVKKDYCDIYNDSSIQIIEGDPQKNYLYITMGCLIENILIAASYFRIFKDVEYYGKGRNGLLARVYFEKNSKKDGSRLDKSLLDAIPRRINARGIFQSKKINKNIMSDLYDLNDYKDIQMSLIDKMKDINKAAELTAEGISHAYNRKTFRYEMSKWINNNLSSKKRGIPGYSLKMPLFLSIIFPIIIPYVNLGEILSRLNYKSVSSAPLIVAVSSKSKDFKSMIEVGRISQRIMLYLASKNIRHSIFVASLEAKSLKRKLKELTKTNYDPEFLLCAGYMATSQKHTPRLPLASRIMK